MFIIDGKFFDWIRGGLATCRTYLGKNVNNNIWDVYRMYIYHAVIIIWQYYGLISDKFYNTHLTYSREAVVVGTYLIK